MTRFLYIADTHLGAAPMRFMQQPGYPDRLGEILQALREWIREAGQVDFILHAGDVLDAPGAEAIAQAREAFALGPPVYVCLGNHDLTEPGAVANWRAEAADFLPNGAVNYTIERGDCVIHVVPNQWDDQPYFWAEVQREHFTPEQWDFLRRGLADDGRVHILATHSPVFGLPVEQTGFAEPYHPPEASFTRGVTALADDRPCLRVVLGGHNHMNMHVNRAGAHYVTASALVEAPFEFKVFDVAAGQVRMRTVSLAPRLGFAWQWDESKAYVQGRSVDRQFDDG